MGIRWLTENPGNIKFLFCYDILDHELVGNGSCSHEIQKFLLGHAQLKH